MQKTKTACATLIAALLLAGCSPEPSGLAPAAPARTTVKMDFFHKPLPEIALPNDVATRYDPSSPTGRRINASMISPTGFESRTRALLDELDGWGVLQPIVVPFTGPLDVRSITRRHDDDDYATDDDAIYLINIDRDSPNFGELQLLDVGNGNYPVVVERPNQYWPNDPRGDSMSLFFDETDEDLNHNGRLDAGEDINGNGSLDAGEDLDGDGVLDPPEDTDADGLLDVANYLPGQHPATDDLAGRADALMYFYERATNSLILRPLVPLDDRTTYAVVVTRRVFDAGGQSVGSPYPSINHISQNEELKPLLEVLPPGVGVGDIAFTWAFTTETVTADWQAVRDGLYDHGPQAHLGQDYPAKLDTIEPMRDAAAFPDMKMPHLLYGENWKPAFADIAKQLLGRTDGEMLDELLDGTGWVDFYTVGSYTSPQLFPRFADEAEETMLPLNDQVWPQDLTSQPAAARPETVYYTLAVPRKEVSVRGEGKPAPVVILGHGYTGNRFDVMEFASYFTRHGLAVIGIDGPSHGIGLSAGDLVLAQALVAEHGISVGAKALLSDRAFDQNFDGAKDSGADFWTSYLFHTRDMVRQYTLDDMQLIRLIRSFDGQRRWDFDVDGDGQNELAGDFDADGKVDIGLGSPIYAFGGSLGGIMSMIMGAVEPAVDAIAPVSGGGGYGEMGPRSTQSGVYQAFILRMMGPLFIGTIDPDSGELLLETIVVDLNDDARFTLATLDGVKPWDTMLVENLRNGARRCGFVSPEGTVRASSESNLGDPLRISFYHGPQLVAGSTTCELRRDTEPFAVVDHFGEKVLLAGEVYEAGSELVALQEGLGMRRGHPDFRALSGLAQMVLDPADPAALARHLLRDPLSYAGSGETTGAHALIITTMGDTAVPVSGGALVGRASGLIDYLEPDPRYGKSANQVLIDTYTLEGVNTLKRYVDSEGNGVHLDVENFSAGTDMFGTEVPRFDPPLRLGMNDTDPLGGKSAAIFPYNVPGGQHGFDSPGEMTDKARQQCLDQCTEPEPDPCGCSALEIFDVGRFMTNMIGRYFRSGGTKLDADLCQSRGDCPDLAPAPPARDPASLP